MKLLLMFLLCFSTPVVYFGQDEFYSKVLSYDDCRNCYFIALDVSSASYTGRVVVENDDLYLLLNKTKGFNKEQYKNFVQNLLAKKERLVLKNASLDKYGSFINVKGVGYREIRVVKEASNVEKVASKGCIAFVKNYFLHKPLKPIEESASGSCKNFVEIQKEDLLLRLDVSEDEKGAIINKLFEWQIPIYFNSLAGSLEIKK